MPTTARAYFDDQSSDWAKFYDGGSMSPRVARFVEALKERAEPKGALWDIGCGTGQIAAAMAAMGWQVTACDLSKGMLAEAEKLHGNVMSYQPLEDIGSHPLPAAMGSVQAVVSSSVLEYVPDAARAIQHLAMALAPGGWLLVTVPDMRHPRRKLEKLLRPLARLARMIPHRKIRGIAEYLIISHQRVPLAQWHSWAVAAGLEPEPWHASESPLAMMIARKP